MQDLISEMEEYAKTNDVPIMETEGINFLTDYIEKNNIVSILEIGAAIGYSSIKMCLVHDNITVTTVERDDIRYNEAIKNIKKAKLEERITIYHNDAFNIDLKDQYDLIFIDAAKAQYTKFFEKFKNNLKDNGVIITDNLNFHGLTHTNEKIESRNVRQLVRKINNYIDFLKENNEFDTTFLEIGDGIAISKRRK